MSSPAVVTAPAIVAEDVLRFWLGEQGAPPLANASLWWKKDEALDLDMRERFGDALDRGVRGELADWEATPRGRLGLVVLFDQLSRNMFRGTAKSFAQDPLAQAASKRAFAAGDANGPLEPVAVSFLLMPFMHAEDLTLQQRAADGFAKLAAEATDEKLRANFENSLKYAKLHIAIIERFGRFPHRNAIVDRPSTPEELEFLKQPGSSF